MRVLVLGGDGYLGWPTSMHLSSVGHEVMAVDNYLRRRLCREESVEPLFEVAELRARAKLWKEKSGKQIEVRIGDLADWTFVSEIFETFKPDALVHYAEQPAAPYSMLGRRAAQLTLTNNLTVTLNIIYGVREFVPNCHIVKLGTMGEYGTPDIDIEEGWLEVEHKGRKQKFLYPRQAGSLYHTTKIMDTDLLWFYTRVWGIRVTDLMQGPVYGLQTDETGEDDTLYSFLNYDEIFGTVLNRFIVQAIYGFPLTVYGKGGQTRGYLNLKDTLNCIRLSVENPAQPGELRIFNQFTETFSVTDLAERVIQGAKSMGIDARMQSVDNPRKEAEEHYYNPAHTGLLSLGLKPHSLDNETVVGMLATVAKYRNQIDPSKFLRGVRWG